MITTRPADINDLDAVMKVIREAQAFLAAQNIDQWQNDFPNPTVITSDITKNTGHVFEKDGKIVAFFAFCPPPEPVYAVLEGGRWLNDTENYGAIHRVAVSSACRGSGIGHLIYEEAIRMSRERGYASVRVDTHPDNKIMRHIAQSHGFELCGTVYYPVNMKRVAFEKLL